MSTRLALYDLARRHAVPAQALPVLAQAAGLDDEPAGLQPALWRGVAVLAVALVGFGLVLWVAANWASLGRMGRFAVLQAAVLACCVAAAARPRLRPAAALGALLGIGGLFAYFGQTYQTGADAWQLFALWAALALPLCAASRSDVAWTPWALVASTAVALWTQAHTGHRWRVEPRDLGTFAIAWTALALLVASLSPALRRWTGAGPWAFRAFATLAIVQVMLGGLGGLFHSPVAPHYVLAIGLLAAAGAALAPPRSFDVFVLSALALALDTLLVAGLARLLLEGRTSRDPFGQMLMIGLAAAGLLAASVHLVLRSSRRAAAAQEAA